MFGWFGRKSRRPVRLPEEEGDTMPAEEGKIKRDDSVTVQVLYREEDQSDLAIAQHIGTRKVQQDSCFLSEQTRPYVYGVLCDGMGGMEDGEKISADVVVYFARYLSGIEKEETVPEMIRLGIREINDKMLNCYAQSNAGTTLSLALMWENRLYWASVGDSRIYLIRGREIAQLTRDHNYGLELKDQVQAGKITEEEAKTNPQREALISYIGAPVLEVMDLSSKPFLLETGDVVLLCSDGLTKSLRDDQILAIIQKYRHTPEECVRMLTMSAFDEGDGGKDNTTVIFMHYPWREKAQNIEE